MATQPRTVEIDCPICGMRLRVPVIEFVGARQRCGPDLQWLLAHFRTHGPGDDGERQPSAA